MKKSVKWFLTITSLLLSIICGSWGIQTIWLGVFCKPDAPDCLAGYRMWAYIQLGAAFISFAVFLYLVVTIFLQWRGRKSGPPAAKSGTTDR